MVRKCSYCGNIGHNSRTCTTYKNSLSTTSRSSVVNNGIRLFGVQLELSSTCPSSCCSHVNNNNIAMKKCFSLDCLLSSSPPPPTLLNYSSPSPSTSSRLSVNENNSNKTFVGYSSDGVFGRAQKRKKGMAWTEEEHINFLSGLEKLGKGYWRGISKNFVLTRTPTQVASHAQKYFLRQSLTLHKKKRRSSLFDMIGESNKSTQSQANMSNSKPSDTNNAGDGDDKCLTRTSSLDVQSDSSQFKVSQNKAIPTWPCGSSPTSHKNSSSSKSIIPLMKSISPNEAPNLELTLAPPSATPTPRPLYQDNSTLTSLLFGPISVI